MNKRNFLYTSIIFACLFASCKTTQTPQPAQTTTKEHTTVEKEETHHKVSPTSAVAQKIRGEWIILKANGKDVETSDEKAYIFFNSDDNKIYGNLGCNYINGEYEVSNRELKLNNVITTTMDCEYLDSEHRIVNALNHAASFTRTKKDGMDYLDIKDKTGKVVLHTKRHNADILTGVWQVSSIHSTPINNTDIQLVIDIPESRINGFAGCNIINGEIGLNRSKDWFIQFQNIATTMKMCDNDAMNTERNLLVALEEVEYIKRNNADSFCLLDKDNKEVICLKRVKLESINNGL